MRKPKPAVMYREEASASTRFTFDYHQYDAWRRYDRAYPSSPERRFYVGHISWQEAEQDNN